MNALDKKIAELKGWIPEIPIDKLNSYTEAYWLDKDGERTDFAVIGFYNCCGVPGFDHGERIPEFNPSEDDGLAFGLVDELTGFKTNRLGEFFFSMFLACPGDPINEIKDKTVPWHTCFTHSTRLNDRGMIIARGHGKTRPEAICRAYIAAVEWMKGVK